MYQVYLGLGSNLGNRQDNLSHAIEELRSIMTVGAVSSIYETEPVDMEQCADFYNMVIEVQTTADPPLLLAQIKKIERKLGRRSKSQNEPRTIDIDILLYRGFAYQDNTVEVPHPGLVNRRFALEPLAEIAPTAVHPILERTVASLLRSCRDRHRIVKTDLHLSPIDIL